MEEVKEFIKLSDIEKQPFIEQRLPEEVSMLPVHGHVENSLHHDPQHRTSIGDGLSESVLGVGYLRHYGRVDTTGHLQARRRTRCSGAKSQMEKNRRSHVLNLPLATVYSPKVLEYRA